MADLDNILIFVKVAEFESISKAALSLGMPRLLPKWTSPQIPVFAMYPSRKFVPSRLRVFLEALAAWKSPLWTRD
jgi:DNA-binding transcriptional LysR family regulator